MVINVDFVDGVVSAKENGLLKNKILRMCEMSPEEAFRMLSESGFFRGEEVFNVFEYERVLQADERDIDAFIREYAPAEKQKAYLFAPRDFHNAKALVKAAYLGADAEKMLAPEGMYTVEEIQKAVDGQSVKLNKYLLAAVEEAQTLLSGEEDVSGAQIGAVFEKHMYAYLFSVCGHTGLLKKLLKNKVDMGNILTFMRSDTPEYAQSNAITGGYIKVEKMLPLFSENEDEAECALDKTYLKDFWRDCLKRRKNGVPQTEAEKQLASTETLFLQKNKYELKREETFLYYIFRRRAENANVRIVLSCLIAGMDENAIKRRLRTF